MQKAITTYQNLELTKETIDAIGPAALESARAKEIAACDAVKQYKGPMILGFVLSAAGFVFGTIKNDPILQYTCGTAFAADAFLAVNRYKKYNELMSNAKALDKALVIATKDPEAAVFKDTVPGLIGTGHIAQKNALVFSGA